MAKGRNSDHERELVEACVARSRLAWRELTITYTPVMKRAIRKILGREAKHKDFFDDILQKTWLDLCQDNYHALSKFDPSLGSLAVFLAGFARLRTKHLLEEYRRQCDFIREIVDEAGRTHREVPETHVEADLREFEATLPRGLRDFLDKDLLGQLTSSFPSEFTEKYCSQMKWRILKRLQEFEQTE